MPIAHPNESRRTPCARSPAAAHGRAVIIGVPLLKVPTVLRKTVLSTVAVATVTLGLGVGQGAATAAAPLASAAPMATTVQDSRLTKLVTEAKTQTTLGIPYLYGGGHGPTPAPLRSRVDCSGFVRELYKYAFGVDIGSGSGDSIVRQSGKFTRTANPVPGDVALFGNSGSAPAYHAGIYVGLINGHPAIAASPTTGSNIKIQQWYSSYWAGDLMGYWHYNGAIAVDSAQLVQQPRMEGRFENTTGTPGGLRLWGWTIDPQRKASSATVAVSIDNRLIAYLPTNALRADVNQTKGVTGNHGFSAAIPFPVGRHTVCVTARSAGTSTTAVALGCKAVTVPVPTRGSFGTATGSARAFAVTGWAYDPSLPAASNVVRVTLDGRVLTNIRAFLARPDVNRTYGITGGHGFAVRLAAAAGPHTVCTISLPASTNSFARSLGCKVVTVTS